MLILFSVADDRSGVAQKEMGAWWGAGISAAFSLICYPQKKHSGCSLLGQHENAMGQH